jgi:hypothetical protein
MCAMIPMFRICAIAWAERGCVARSPSREGLGTL